MKKLACVFAVVVMSIGMFSCTNDSAEDQNLYETQATDGNDNGSDGRDG